MSLESGRDLSMEQLKAMNRKPQALSMNSNPQSTPTPEAQIPEQTQTPMPQPIVIQCGIPAAMERLEQRLSDLEQLSNMQVNLLRKISESGNPYPTWEQMQKIQDSLLKITTLLEQAGKPKEKHSWLRKVHLPKITLPEVDWPTAILILMALAALVMIWLCLGKNLSGWMSLLR